MKKEVNRTKDDRLHLRIGADEKQKIKDYCIENGYKSITDFIMSCFEEKIIKKQ